MELQQVTADANKKVAEAEGDSKAQVARAEGEAKANQIRSSSITDKLLANRALDNEHDRIWKWDGQMPSTVLGSGGSTLFQLK